MALGASKIQHLRARAYQPGRLKVNTWYQKAKPSAQFARRAQVLGRWDLYLFTTSSTTWLVAGSTNTTRLFTTIYLYDRIAGTSTATSCGTEYSATQSRNRARTREC